MSWHLEKKGKGQESTDFYLCQKSKRTKLSLGTVKKVK